MAFKVGDRVVIVKSTVPRRIGEVTTVVSEAYWPWCPGGSGHAAGLCWCSEGPLLVHDLATASDLADGVVAYPPSHLDLLRDDGHEKAEWTDELRRLCQVGKVDA
jgi:hypothetical protein